MANFNQYLVTVEVVSAGADYCMESECTFSVAAVDKSTVRSSLPLTEIPHVTEYEVIDIKEQN